MNKTEHNKKAILQALEKTLGVVTSACRAIGLGRTTFYEYYKEESFKKQVDSIKDIAIDMAESQLHKQILGGNTAATIFYLKTIGKKRGYVERQEITGAEGLPTNVTVEIIRNENKD